MSSIEMLILSPISLIFWIVFGYYFLFKSKKFKAYFITKPKSKQTFLSFWIVLVLIAIYGVIKIYVDYFS